jgi:hypothetical protein
LREEDKLKLFESGVLRKMFGFKREYVSGLEETV